MPSHIPTSTPVSSAPRRSRGRSCTTSARSSTRPVPMSRRRSDGTCRPSRMPAACSAAWRRSSGMPRSGSGSAPPSSMQPASASAWAVSAARLDRGSAAAPNAARADPQGRPAQRSRREGRAGAAHARRCSQRPALRTRCRRHGRHSRRSARASGTSTSNGCSRPRARRRADAASPRPSRRSARESAPLETPRRLNATKVRSAASFSQRSGAIGQNGSSFVSQ